MAWIQPLNLEVWLVNVFSGTPEIFMAIALIVISGMAGYFRMPVMLMIMMLGTFLLLFMNTVISPILILMIVFGGLGIGIALGRFAQ